MRTSLIWEFFICCKKVDVQLNADVQNKFSQCFLKNADMQIKHKWHL